MKKGFWILSLAVCFWQGPLKAEDSSAINNETSQASAVPASPVPGDWDQCYYACMESYETCTRGCGSSSSCYRVCYYRKEACIDRCRSVGEQN